MRNKPDPNDKYDQQELKNLAAEPWMLELLNLNPDYCGWGPHEDYMCGTGDGWNSRILCSSWQDFRKSDELAPKNQSVGAGRPERMRKFLLRSRTRFCPLSGL